MSRSKRKITKILIPIIAILALVIIIGPKLVSETTITHESETTKQNISALIDSFNYSMYQTKANQSIDLASLLVKDTNNQQSFLENITIESEVDTTVPGKYPITINYDNGVVVTSAKSEVEILDLKHK